MTNSEKLKAVATGDIMLGSILVLGIGSDMGRDYKMGIYKVIRPCAKVVIACDKVDNPLAERLVAEGLIDQFISVETLDANIAFQEIKNAFFINNLKVDAVVTYREEWLQVRTMLAKDMGLPHPLLSANQISQSKSKTKHLLSEKGFHTLKYKVAKLLDVAGVAEQFGFPIFIKPVDGIRSEWARWISNKGDLKQYIDDLLCGNCANEQELILEEAINGHEVDADIVLYNGKLVYAGVSDNFPVNRPFALETGHLMPSILSPEIVEIITDYAYKASIACGYDRGVLHIELMVRPQCEVVLLEINGRLGGMYIAEWHKKIWGVDLIKAELAISSGIDPLPYLQKKEPECSIAQICVTANSEDNKLKEKSVQILGWENFEQIKNGQDFFRIEQWVSFPHIDDIAVNGHSNLGEMSVLGSNPLSAFQKLLSCCKTNRPKLITNKGLVEMSTRVLINFGYVSPRMNRYVVRKAENSDMSYIKDLLSSLTQRASQAFQQSKSPFLIPQGLEILVVVDTFAFDSPVIAMTALHIWERLRPASSLTCFIHDFVVHSDYRGVGIGKMLLTSVLGYLDDKGVYKVDLSCEHELKDFYYDVGFQDVGVHLVKYSS